MSLSGEVKSQIYYFISTYRKRYEAYPNAELGFWNYIKKNNDSDVEIDIDLNSSDFCEPSFEWKRKCDKYIREFYVEELFMNYMRSLRETKVNILPLKKDLSITAPNIYDLSIHGLLSNIYVRVEDSFVVLYPKKELECFNGTLPRSPTLEEEECLSNIDQWKIDFYDGNEEEIGESLGEFLQEYEPNFYSKLVEGDGIFFGDHYRNDGYFFFNGQSIVGSVADVPDTHDYGVPPREVRRFYPFNWSTYGFLSRSAEG